MEKKKQNKKLKDVTFHLLHSVIKEDEHTKVVSSEIAISSRGKNKYEKTPFRKATLLDLKIYLKEFKEFLDREIAKL